jgi:hypothetical protein
MVCEAESQRRSRFSHLRDKDAQMWSTYCDERLYPRMPLELLGSVNKEMEAATKRKIDSKEYA